MTCQQDVPLIRRTPPACVRTSWAGTVCPSRFSRIARFRKGAARHIIGFVEISLEGKVALVTGVGPNIGSGIALALARYGAKVACNDVDDAAIKACIARIERNGGEAMAAPGDVTDEKAVQGYIGSVLEKWGRLDILVNNAALLRAGGAGIGARDVPQHQARGPRNGRARH
jgi:hypothetical protein